MKMPGWAQYAFGGTMVAITFLVMGLAVLWKRGPICIRARLVDVTVQDEAGEPIYHAMIKTSRGYYSTTRNGEAVVMVLWGDSPEKIKASEPGYLSRTVQHLPHLSCVTITLPLDIGQEEKP